MKTRILTVIALGFALTLNARAQVPGIINYQGRIVDNGTNFTGTGQFEFALVNPGGGTNYWANDGTAVGQPSAHVLLGVTNGLYSVLLGNAPMTVIPATVFANSNVLLRVWFSDGSTNVFQQLSPDQRIAAAGYAFQAQNAAVAAVANSFLSSGVVQGSDLNIGSGNAANGLYASVAGGQNNTAGAADSFIGGGYGNTASAVSSTVGGGDTNTACSLEATVSGGSYNSACGPDATIGGGYGNTNEGPYATIGGGFNNSIQINVQDSTIGGGIQNTIQVTAYESTIGGGNDNTIQSNAYGSTISGGIQNTIDINSYESFIGGGADNTIQSNAYGSTISGGTQNTIQAESQESTIGGGNANIIEPNAYFSTIGGGQTNEIHGHGWFSTIGGGQGNTTLSNAYYSTIGGGNDNTVGAYATVPGGSENVATGSNSLAAGTQAQALYPGDFVWADDSIPGPGSPFTSTGNNQFLIRATGGVGINTNNPSGYALYVNGSTDVNGSIYTASGVAIGTTTLSGYELNVDGNAGVSGTMTIGNTGSAALYVSGSGCVLGTLYYGALGGCSDARFKKDVRTLPDALESIAKLRGVSFKWKTAEFSNHHFADGPQIGFIAQEVKEVLPEVVSQSSDGYYAVDYSRLTPVLVEALKEQQHQIQAQVKEKDAQIVSLEKRLELMESKMQKVNEQMEQLKAAPIQTANSHDQGRM